VISNSGSSTAEAQAAIALWTFVHARVRRFTTETALDVVKALSAFPDQTPQKLARRLRLELASHGVHLKHISALEAASRLLGYKSWHAEGASAALPTLQVDYFSGGPTLSLGGWSAVSRHLCTACDAALKESTSRIILLRVETRSLTLFLHVTSTKKGNETSTSLPLLIVTPIGERDKWLEGSAGALEVLRRHLEERHAAIMDGMAVLQVCTREMPIGLATHPEPVCAKDAPNAELVLMRQDNPLDEAGNEVARGDELLCWSQLELAEEQRHLQITIDEETGGWRIGKRCYVWEISILRPNEYVPGLIVANLTVAESRALLRRYRIAKRLLSHQISHDETNKRLQYLGGPDEAYRVDSHRLLHLMRNAGLSWDAYTAGMNPAPSLESKLPLGFILPLLEQLKLPDPNVIWARPTQAEMSQLCDDQLLRALMPRVDHVTYHIPVGLDAGLQKEVRDAIHEFSTSMVLQKQIGFRFEEPLPHLVYAGDGEELRLALERLGLCGLGGGHSSPVQDRWRIRQACRRYAAVRVRLQPLSRHPPSRRRIGRPGLSHCGTQGAVRQRPAWEYPTECAKPISACQPDRKCGRATSCHYLGLRRITSNPEIAR
jgi:hypothetical protein